MDTKTKETLQKQLQLLSERSQSKEITNGKLVTLSDAMAKIASLIPYDTQSDILGN